MVVIMQLITSGILCLIGVLLIAVHVIVLYRYSHQNSAANQVAGGPQLADESGGGGGEGCRALRSGDFEKLPLFRYSKDQTEKGPANTECAVCLDNFKEGEECRLLLICNHSFHAACIDLWLRKTPSCPVCRTWPVPS